MAASRQVRISLTLLCACGLSRASHADLSSGKRLHTTNTIRDGQLLQRTKNTLSYHLIRPEVPLLAQTIERLEEADWPDGMSQIDAFPGFYRKSVQLENNVSLTKSRLMCWTTFRKINENIKLKLQDRWVGSEGWSHGRSTRWKRPWIILRVNASPTRTETSRAFRPTR